MSTTTTIGSAAWLRAKADTLEAMRECLGSLDEEDFRSTEEDIVGLRIAADRLEAATFKPAQK